MDDFDDCSEQELAALKLLSEGVPSRTLEPDLIQSLVDKNLLEEYQGEYIFPALVWSRWQLRK
jgi:hypothetical protein